VKRIAGDERECHCAKKRRYPRWHVGDRDVREALSAKEEETFTTGALCKARRVDGLRC
jgi:hypothetical protein